MRAAAFGAVVLTATASGAFGNRPVVEMVINNPGTGGVFQPGETVNYSLWLRDGEEVNGFVGWSNFSGIVLAPGTHLVPDELTVTDQTGVWEGRRPPAFPGPPGGTAGGFRFVPQTYTPITNGLTGENALTPFAGMAASAAQGGFNWDDSPDLEVLRGSFVADVIGVHELTFDPEWIGYFGTPAHSNPIIVTDPRPFADFVSAPYTVVPTPSAIGLLVLAGCASRRRR